MSEVKTENHIIEKTFVCIRCGHVKEVQKSGGTGYGVNDKGEKTCYACCGELDRTALLKEGKATLYFDSKERTVSNWPGTFKIKNVYFKRGRHNIAGVRYDTWFTLEGIPFHGYTIGDMTQIHHVRRVKKPRY